MKKKNYTPWIVLGVVVLLLLMVVGWYVGTYNTLIGVDEEVNLRWSNLESAYQRRADLIPNVVSTVQGSSDFEQDTLTAVVEARSKATSVQLTPELLSNPEAVNQFKDAQGELSSALSRLLVSVERYPDIKSTQAYRDLIIELEGSENRIKIERDNYNKAVKSYNVQVRRIPTNIVASMSGFTIKQGFESDDGADAAPAVEFN